MWVRTPWQNPIGFEQIPSLGAGPSSPESRSRTSVRSDPATKNQHTASPPREPVNGWVRTPGLEPLSAHPYVITGIAKNGSGPHAKCRVMNVGTAREPINQNGQCPTNAKEPESYGKILRIQSLRDDSGPYKLPTKSRTPSSTWRISSTNSCVASYSSHLDFFSQGRPIGSLKALSTRAA